MTESSAKASCRYATGRQLALGDDRVVGEGRKALIFVGPDQALRPNDRCLAIPGRAVRETQQAPERAVLRCQRLPGASIRPRPAAAPDRRGPPGTTAGALSRFSRPGCR